MAPLLTGPPDPLTRATAFGLGGVGPTGNHSNRERRGGNALEIVWKVSCDIPASMPSWGQPENLQETGHRKTARIDPQQGG